MDVGSEAMVMNYGIMHIAWWIMFHRMGFIRTVLFFAILRLSIWRLSWGTI